MIGAPEVSSRIRLSIIGIVIAALFFGLLARLWFLQVAQSSSFAAQTTANRIRTIEDPGVRGRILDATGKVLVQDQAITTLVLQRGLLPDQMQKSVHNLASLLNTTPAAIMHTIDTTQAAAF